MLTDYVTMEDIQAEVDVTPRTIRTWVARGLLPRPLRASEGYKKGVIGFYPRSSLATARMLNSTRFMPLDERAKIVQHSSNYSLIIEDDGTIVITVKARSAWEKNNG